ncbi:MAG: hypothetical protein LBR15_07260 [Methanobrevibacter sp.]|jgi:hypothetical protein|nr:hypothetical protein [Candidatus Methanovirga australis]
MRNKNIDNTNIDSIHEEIYKEDFTNILKMIKESQQNALRSVNTELIDLYWNIGKFIHR